MLHKGTDQRMQCSYILFLSPLHIAYSHLNKHGLILTHIHTYTQVSEEQQQPSLGRVSAQTYVTSAPRPSSEWPRNDKTPLLLATLL